MLLCSSDVLTVALFWIFLEYLDKSSYFAKTTWAYPNRKQIALKGRNERIALLNIFWGAVVVTMCYVIEKETKQMKTKTANCVLLT